jgi:peptidoglycan/xylan/chitin deacetylase (PgdA/CDA1 family)
MRRKLARWPRLGSWLCKKIQCATGWAKVFVASGLYHSGLVGLVRSIKQAFHLGNVKIFCFHDISEHTKMSSDFSILLHPEHFTQFIRFLVQNYRTASLQESIRLLENGQRLSEDVMSLTLDDCYKGWITHVLPLCQQLQVPFAGFVTTQPLDSEPLLYDALIFLARNTWRKVAVLSRWGLGVFLLNGFEDISSFVEVVHNAWRGRSSKERNQFLQELSEYLEVSLNSEELRNTLLDWNDVRKMDMSGITIGAHSVSHGYFPNLSEDEYSWEILQSKRRLEEELGHSIDFFAYPYGISDYQDIEKARTVAKAGFRNAFTLDMKYTNKVLPFKIPRHSVSQGMFVDPHGNFSEPLLATELCGLGDIIFGRVLKLRQHGRKTQFYR